MRAVGDVVTTGTRAPRSADAQILAGVGLGPSDVGSGYVVSLLEEGDQLSQPTLDFCGLHFASESRREARHQVVAGDSSGSPVMSTEAVLYRDQPSAAEAMGEVRGIGSRCPSAAVPGAVAGEPSLVWRVHEATTAGWPATGDIDRMALAVSAAEPGSDAHEEVVVYLRRGRLVIGVYFVEAAGPQPGVSGARSVGAIVGVFQRRLAALPVADVS
jgi:hypothetical protein